MATTFNSLSFASETFAMAARIKVKRRDRKMFLDKFLAPHLSSRNFSPTVAQTTPLSLLLAHLEVRGTLPTGFSDLH